MIKHFHLIGIGGIGMGALASLLHHRGYKVTGSDQQINTMTQFLTEKGDHRLSRS
jgi:UDP-N-acetylmuramate-alanine ligase